MKKNLKTIDYALTPSAVDYLENFCCSMYFTDFLGYTFQMYPNDKYICLFSVNGEIHIIPKNIKKKKVSQRLINKALSTLHRNKFLQLKEHIVFPEYERFNKLYIRPYRLIVVPGPILSDEGVKIGKKTRD